MLTIIAFYRNWEYGKRYFVVPMQLVKAFRKYGMDRVNFKINSETWIEAVLRRVPSAVNLPANRNNAEST